MDLVAASQMEVRSAPARMSEINELKMITSVWLKIIPQENVHVFSPTLAPRARILSGLMKDVRDESLDFWSSCPFFMHRVVFEHKSLIGSAGWISIQLPPNMADPLNTIHGCGWFSARPWSLWHYCLIKESCSWWMTTPAVHLRSLLFCLSVKWRSFVCEAKVGMYHMSSFSTATMIQPKQMWMLFHLEEVFLFGNESSRQSPPL